MIETIRASDLISHLQQAIEEHGDQEVRLPSHDSDDPLDCQGVVVIAGDKDTASYFLISDNNTIDILEIDPTENSILTH